MENPKEFYKKFNDLKNGKEVQVGYFDLFQHSDFPRRLKTLLNQIKVYVSVESLKRIYFQDDKEKRTVLNIRIIRAEKEISFLFGCSINDTELFNNLNTRGNEPYILAGIKFIKSLLYTILCCCKSDFYIPIDFDDFCLEFGYNNDSIKAKRVWEECLKQSSKLQKIFLEKEVECLPN